MYDLAVTLEGTIIHKSGLITGGRSSHGSGKKWEEKDIQSMLSSNIFFTLYSLFVLQAYSAFETPSSRNYGS